MVPDLLAGYTFLAAITAKDDVEGLVPMLLVAIRRMTGFQFYGNDTNGDGFPDKVGVRWAGGPTIARGLSEYFGNLMSNPDTWISLVAAIGPGFVKSYSPISAPGKINSAISIIEEAGSKSFVAVLAGTIFDPPPEMGGTNTQANANNANNAAFRMRSASRRYQSTGRAYADSPVPHPLPYEFRSNYR